MDNLSHTLAGLALGELVQRTLPPEPDSAANTTRRRLLLTAGALACNFPDLDLVLTRLLPSPLGYLLHHRGHTHTLLYAVPQALLLAVLLWALWPAARRLLHASASARAGLALTIAGALVLHMAMDYLNSYGLHPFHPFDSRWLYGDMVFILEPVFWVACGVPLAMMLRRPALRALCTATLAAALAWFTFQGYLHWASLAALFAIGAGLAWLQQRAGPRGRGALMAALLAGTGFAALQGAASSHGRQIVTAHLAMLDPASATRDVAMTAYPANPLCWNFVSVERDSAAQTYRVRRGRMTLAPALLPLAACPPAIGERVAAAPGAHVALSWESAASLASLRALNAQSCQFSAWLRFARAPALGPDSATDVRFGSDPQANFTTLAFARFAGQPCGPIPQWGMPRGDLLMP